MKTLFKKLLKKALPRRLINLIKGMERLINLPDPADGAEINRNIDDLRKLLIFNAALPAVIKKCFPDISADGEYADQLLRMAQPDILGGRDKLFAIAEDLILPVSRTSEMSMAKKGDVLLRLAQSPLLSNVALTYLLRLYLPYYGDDEKAAALNNLFNISKKPLFADMWVGAKAALKYAGFLLLRGENEPALDILKQYIGAFGLREIPLYLPAADLAYRNGLFKEETKISHKLFGKIIQNRKNKTLESYLRGKSVAVVGNGPQEIGKGLGGEIDSHDVVVRFNNYHTSKHIEDYGQKTDLVALSYFFTPVCTPPNRFLMSESVFFYEFGYSAVIAALSAEGVEVFDIEEGNAALIQNMFNINRPSSGLSVLHYLKGITDIEIKDTYGFALKYGYVDDRHRNNMSLHSDPLHNYEMEFDALLSIFNG